MITTRLVLPTKEQKKFMELEYFHGREAALLLMDEPPKFGIRYECFWYPPPGIAVINANITILRE
jgi:hypothetical protein